MKSTATQEGTTMNHTAFGDAVSAITHNYATGTAATRAGDMAEAMASVPTMDRASIIAAVVAYLTLAGFLSDDGANTLAADLDANTPQR